jgi:hypothetical protein
VRTIGLAISRTLVPGIEGTNVGAYLRDLFTRANVAVFVMPEVPKVLRAMMARYCPDAKAVPFVPRLTKYKKKADAYMARAVELCEAAQEMFAFHDNSDWTNSSVMIASTFAEVHPGYALVTYLVVDGEVLDVSLDEMKKVSGYKG